jgi:hypothetical protein
MRTVPLQKRFEQRSARSTSRLLLIAAKAAALAGHFKARGGVKIGELQIGFPVHDAHQKSSALGMRV